MHSHKPSSVRFFPQVSDADANNAVSGLRIDRMSICSSKQGNHCRPTDMSHFIFVSINIMLTLASTMEKRNIFYFCRVKTWEL